METLNRMSLLDVVRALPGNLVRLGIGDVLQSMYWGADNKPYQIRNELLGLLTGAAAELMLPNLQILLLRRCTACSPEALRSLAKARLGTLKSLRATLEIERPVGADSEEEDIRVPKERDGCGGYRTWAREVWDFGGCGRWR